MIGSLRGTLLARRGAEFTIEVAGVGYRCAASPGLTGAAGEEGAELFCWIHHHIREDAQTLYAFATEDERQLFEALIGAHGVGPALAMSILGVHSPLALARAVAADDVAALCLVPGVGKKTAARLLVELKSRLDVGSFDSSPTVDGSGPDVSDADSVSSARADVRSALAELGYSADETNQAIAALPEGDNSGDLLRAALGFLAGG
ncbi:MAG: Holliday junction branch migration protein RuvA [Candidatus Microthrix parvicella]|jgi:Holliday junction DNA helicase RuvA